MYGTTFAVHVVLNELYTITKHWPGWKPLASSTIPPRPRGVVAGAWRFSKLSAGSLYYMGESNNEGALFRSPYGKDRNMLGSILGPSVYGSPHTPLSRQWQCRKQSQTSWPKVSKVL